MVDETANAGVKETVPAEGLVSGKEEVKAAAASKKKPAASSRKKASKARAKRESRKVADVSTSTARKKKPVLDNNAKIVLGVFAVIILAGALAYYMGYNGGGAGAGQQATTPETVQNGDLISVDYVGS